MPLGFHELFRPEPTVRLAPKAGCSRFLFQARFLHPRAVSLGLAKPAQRGLTQPNQPRKGWRNQTSPGRVGTTKPARDGLAQLDRRAQTGPVARLKRQRGGGEVVVIRRIGAWVRSRSLLPLFPPRLVIPPLPALAAVAIVIAVGAAAGTSLAASRALPAGCEPWLGGGLLGGAALAVAGSLVTRFRSSHKGAWRWLLLALALAVCTWAWWSGRLFPADDLAWSLGETPRPVAVAGRVVRGPEQRLMQLDRLGGSNRGPCSEWLLELSQARHHERWLPVSGRARVFVDDLPKALPVGAVVRVYGRGLRPTPALNPGEYDFADRARRDRILSLIRVRDWSAIVVRASPPWWSVGAAIDRLRAAATAQLRESLPVSERPLAKALLLGSRRALPPDSLERFAATGTSHLLAISGLHVGMLVAAVLAVLRWLSVTRRVIWLTVAVVVTVYAAVIGDAVPVWRATLLVWAACLAVWQGRRTGGLRPLALAAIVLLVWCPAASVAVGTQLSFLATAVLLVVAPWLVPQPAVDPVERLLEESRPPLLRQIRRLARRGGSLAVAGLAVWLAASPLVADSFQRLAPIAIGVNLLLAPVVSMAMASGFCCLLLGRLLPAVGWLSGRLCSLALWSLDSIVTAAAMVPCGSWRVAAPPGWWLAGWYLLVTALLLCWAAARPVRQVSNLARSPSGLRLQAFTGGASRQYALALVGWIGLGLVVGSFPPAPTAGVRVVLAAMGHGCGVVVRTANRHCLVYDAGRLGAGQAAARSLSAVLVSEKIHAIDCLVLSHADADHFNAVPEIIDRFPVRQVAVSADFLASNSAMVQQVLSDISRRGIPLRTVVAGDQIDIDTGCAARVLHPGERQPGTDNEKSVVLAVEAAGHRILLTGDLEGPALRRFLAAGPPRCDVLVAPHHGSHTGMPKELVTQLQPKVVLVSGGGGRCWQAVAAAFGQNDQSLLCLLRTAGPTPTDRGAIAVSLSESQIAVSRFTDATWQLEESITTVGRRPADWRSLAPTEGLGESPHKRVGQSCVAGTTDCPHQIKGEQPPDQKQNGATDQASDLPRVKGGGVDTEPILRTRHHFACLRQAGWPVIELLTKETRVARSC